MATQPKQFVLASIEESTNEAALGGHILSAWQQGESGWHARCKRCRQTTWVGELGYRYSLLRERCVVNLGDTNGAYPDIGASD